MRLLLVWVSFDCVVSSRVLRLCGGFVVFVCNDRVVLTLVCVLL